MKIGVSLRQHGCHVGMKKYVSDRLTRGWGCLEDMGIFQCKPPVVIGMFRRLFSVG